MEVSIIRPLLLPMALQILRMRPFSALCRRRSGPGTMARPGNIIGDLLIPDTILTDRPFDRQSPHPGGFVLLRPTMKQNLCEHDLAMAFAHVDQQVSIKRGSIPSHSKRNVNVKSEARQCWSPCSSPAGFEWSDYAAGCECWAGTG